MNAASTLAAIRVSDPGVNISLDQDRDGVTDEMDQCPETDSNSTRVDAMGCELVEDIVGSWGLLDAIIGAVVIVLVLILVRGWKRPAGRPEVSEE